MHRVVTDLGGKSVIMQLMTHEDPDVKFRALVAVQRCVISIRELGQPDGVIDWSRIHGKLRRGEVVLYICKACVFARNPYELLASLCLSVCLNERWVIPSTLECLANP